MFHFELNESEIFCQERCEDNVPVSVLLEQVDTSPSCPCCGSHMYRHGYYTRRLKDMPDYPGTSHTLIVKARRFRCPHCGNTLRQKIPFLYSGTNITKRAAEWIKAFLVSKFPISQIAQLTGIHWDTIRAIQNEHIEQALAAYADSQEKSGYKPKYLAVDEFAIRKMHKYATCVMDLETGHVIWASMGRAKNRF